MATIQDFTADLGYPCVGAKTAASKQQIVTVAAHDMRSDCDDARILRSVYNFIAQYDVTKELYQSLVVTFTYPMRSDEETFETLLWQRLQGLHALDAEQFAWDPRVSSDPSQSNFSFSLGGRGFYIVGMHPNSSRRARQYQQPAMVLNLHDQFERLRAQGQYERMKNLVRRRDRIFSGSENPMLTDFNAASEARQYSGRAVDANWKCPFHSAT